MHRPDVIEFWLDDKLFERVHSSFTFSQGSYISIRKKTYVVAQVSFALDHTDDHSMQQLRCNVTLLRMSD